MRPIWTGVVSFGLVTIPVKLISATSQKSVRFRLLAAEDKRPVKYRRYSPTLGRDLEWEEIVKGLEVAPGEYITFTHDELKDLRPERAQTIEVKEFVPQNQLGPVLYQKHYYLEPGRRKDKAYFLLSDVLKESGKAAIATFVLREKEHLCALQEHQGALLLSTLHYAEEMRDPRALDALGERPTISEQERELAEELVKRFSSDQLRLEKYEDRFERLLHEAIKAQETGERVSEGQAVTDEERLLEALQASLEA